MNWRCFFVVVSSMELILHMGFLDNLFEEKMFDFVHMSNSLDHSFDAIAGTDELLYICIIGGKIVLRHHANEIENYDGLHQWNLSVLNEEKFFLTKRKKGLVFNKIVLKIKINVHCYKWIL